MSNGIEMYICRQTRNDVFNKDEGQKLLQWRVLFSQYISQTITSILYLDSIWMKRELVASSTEQRWRREVPVFSWGTQIVMICKISVGQSRQTIDTRQRARAILSARQYPQPIHKNREVRWSNLDRNFSNDCEFNIPNKWSTFSRFGPPTNHCVKHSTSGNTCKAQFRLYVA